MKIRVIELEGFRSWRKRERVDLTGKNMVAIVGDNRAGKTSLLAGIEFALWGSTRGSSVNDVINRACDQARVMLEFELDDNVYRIERIRSRKRHEVLFSIANGDSWTPLAQKHPSAADPVIVETIGMDERTASLTWLMRQNDYAAFCRLSPAARRETLVSAFGLDRFTVLADAAEAVRRELKRETDQAQWELDEAFRVRADAQATLEAHDNLDELREQAVRARERADQATEAWALATANRHGAQAELERLEADFERGLAQTRTREQSLRRRRQTLLVRQERVAQAESQRQADALEVARLDAELGTFDLERYHEALTQADERVASAATKLHKIELRISALDTEREALDRRLEGLNDVEATGSGRCSVCDSELDDAKAVELAQATLEAREALDARLAEGRQRLESAQRAQDRARQDRQRAQNELDQAQNRRTGLEVELAKLRARLADEPVDDAADELADVERELSELTWPQRDEQAEERCREALDVDLDRLDERKAARRDKADKLTELVTVLDTAATTFAEADERAQAAQERLDKLATDTGDAVWIRDQFRPSGIPARILAGLVTELNDRANEVLSQTADDGLGVDVSTTRTSAKGTPVEAVTVFAVMPDGERAEFSVLSGSEQFRVAIALGIGLSRCIAARSGVPVRMLQLDEGWGNLDEHSRSALVGVLRRLSTQFQVLSVSHIDDVKDAFDTTVLVDASSGTSRATVS